MLLHYFDDRNSEIREREKDLCSLDVEDPMDSFELVCSQGCEERKKEREKRDKRNIEGVLNTFYPKRSS